MLNKTVMFIDFAATFPIPTVAVVIADLKDKAMIIVADSGKVKILPKRQLSVQI